MFTTQKVIVLMESGERFCAAKIARKLGVSRQRVDYIAKKLDSKGLWKWPWRVSECALCDAFLSPNAPFTITLKYFKRRLGGVEIVNPACFAPHA